MPTINTKYGERTRFALWVREECLDMVRRNYKEDDCRTQSEYIEKAIEFYTGYLESNKSLDYFSLTLSSLLKNIIGDRFDKEDRLLFKVAVELGMLCKVFSKAYKIDEEYLDDLRKDVVNEIKQTNGTISFQKLVKEDYH